MIQISRSQKLTIYFKTAPYLIGEMLVFMGVVFPIATFPENEGFFGIILFVGGVFLVERKIKNMKKGAMLLQYGQRTTAKIVLIENTNFTHNRRRVMRYHFEYKVDGRSFYYKFRSAFWRELKTGDVMTIFYSKEMPEVSFIPVLYGVHING